MTSMWRIIPFPESFDLLSVSGQLSHRTTARTGHRRMAELLCRPWHGPPPRRLLPRAARGRSQKDRTAGERWTCCRPCTGRRPPSVTRGLTAETVAARDASGCPVHFTIPPGQPHDLKGTPNLLEGLPLEALIADRAFDADSLPTDLESRGIRAVIPVRRNRTTARSGGVIGICIPGGTRSRASLPKSRSSGALRCVSTRCW